MSPEGLKAQVLAAVRLCLGPRALYSSSALRMRGSRGVLLAMAASLPKLKCDASPEMWSSTLSKALAAVTSSLYLCR